MRILYFLSFLILTQVSVAQQNVEFTKANFKSEPGGLKDALKAIQEGDAKYYNYFYADAIPFYQKAQKFNPNNGELNAKIGDCYLNSSEKAKAADYLKKATSLDKNLDGYYFFATGKALHISNQFDEAVKYYKSAKSKGSKLKADMNISALADHKIKECTQAKKLTAAPINVKIESLSEAINTTAEEYVPVITADESELFFTSRRSETTGGGTDLAIADYFEDIYYSKLEKGNWTQAKNMGKPVNSVLHDATVGLSLDGQKLIIYRDTKKEKGNIFMTAKKGNDWQEPEEFPEPINSKYQETSACYSPDGNSIYFVSDRPGGKGGKDIYKTTKDKEGNWGEAENLGNTINTPDDEDAVFIHPDGKTLYFSSIGHPTMGGYDIFKSTFEKGKWSTPENIGYPVNSADDDVCFVLTASGEYGYYTSIKVDGKGKRDIYRVSFLVEINKPKLTLLKGTVTDRKTGEALYSNIELYNNTDDELVGTFESNSATGKFMVSLPAGKDYGISVKSTGYLFYSENFKIPDDAAFQVVEKLIKLDKLEVGKKVVLNNIFYDYNEASLRQSSNNELNKVIELLDHNPKMKIELSAHTDSRGGNAYNNKLSQERAQSCVDYLVSKGVDKSRLIAKGYGESQLVITDAEIEKLTSELAKEEAHQKNRRTEFKIIEN
ncbi:MAG: PD40 domain-containing protein [Flavobacteriales bacterium]|nr:PD40 domain-containing protein [Flavobacteriales bacterium]